MSWRPGHHPHRLGRHRFPFREEPSGFAVTVASAVGPWAPGRADLVSALTEWQGARVFDAQRSYLDKLDSWESWQKWREAITDFYREQPCWGCPIGSMVNELVGSHDQVAASVQNVWAEWQRLLQAGTERMITAGLLQVSTDGQRLGRSILATLQGGLLMTKTTRTEEPLLDALDTIFLTLRAHAVDPPRSGR
jgi:hypothetical protein